MRTLGRVFWRVEVHGAGTIPVDGGLIVASTHESFLDPPMVGCYLPRALRYMARKTLFVKVTNGVEKRKPVATWLGRVFGVIEVNRDAASKDAIRKCLEALERGEAVLLFPEGTRSLAGEVQEFRAGVGLLALRSGAPVVPVSLDGSRRVWPKGRKLPRMGKGPVRIAYGVPVRYEEPAKAEDVAADIRRRILDLRADGQQADARDGADAHGVAGGGPSR